MKSPIRSVVLACAAALLLSGSAAAAAAQNASGQPRYTRVVSSESSYLGSATMSPDARWVVYSQLDSPEESSLWIVPSGGGTPQRLMNKGHFDDGPSWLTNDRLVFTSNRAARGEHKGYGMVLQIDRATGRAVGPPRQITLDAVGGSLKASPDGRSVFYVTREGDGFHLKVVPAQGGNARVVLQSAVLIGAPAWSADSRSIFFTRRLTASTERAVIEIPAQGGQETELFRTAEWVRAISPHGHSVTTSFGGSPSSMTLRDRTGRALATMPLERNSRPVGFAADGRELLLTHDQTVAPMRVVPVHGGGVRTVSDTDFYHWPVGFSSDGSAVLSEIVGSDRQVIVVSPLAGGTARIISLPGERVQSQAFNNGVFAYARPTATDLYRLFAFDLESRRETLLSEHALVGSPFRVNGPGGEWRLGDRFLVLERRAEANEVRSVSAQGESRLIRAVPAATVGRSVYAVHGSRVAWWEMQGDSSFLMLAENATATPRALVAVPGHFSGALELAWSWNGRRLASYWPPAANQNAQPLMLIDVPAAGARATPRLIPTGAQYYYYPKWLPDDSGLVMVAGYGMGVQSHILHVPIGEGAQPVVITRDDPSLKWGFELSPDGRLVAYPGEVPRGSSILRADLRSTLGTANVGTR